MYGEGGECVYVFLFITSEVTDQNAEDGDPQIQIGELLPLLQVHCLNLLCLKASIYLHTLRVLAML